MKSSLCCGDIISGDLLCFVVAFIGSVHGSVPDFRRGDKGNIRTHGYFFFIKCGLYYLSNTPENISISLVEIPNRVANSRHPFIASITSEIIFSAVFRLSI